MLLTRKLIRLLGRVFNKDPGPFLALRLSYDGVMTWTVSDGVLTTAVLGGSGVPLSVSLSDYTVAGLVAFLAAQPGYTVPYADTGENSALSARVLLDATGNPATSNGDHLYGYTSVLWAWLESVGVELEAARAQIDNMVLQMSTQTASDVWLDELGLQYGIPRLVAESDGSYSQRIIAEVLRPRGNNVAMEMAIKVFTGQDTTVTDADAFTTLAHPDFDGTLKFDGSWMFNAAVAPLYGLFDVKYGYDLINGGDFHAFQQVIIDLINRLRDGGTQLRALTLVGSQLQDAVAAPVDGALSLAAHATLSDALDPLSEAFGAHVRFAELADAVDPVSEVAGLTITSDFRFNGVRTFNGSISFRGNTTTTEAL